MEDIDRFTLFRDADRPCRSHSGRNAGGREQSERDRACPLEDRASVETRREKPIAAADDTAPGPAPRGRRSRPWPRPARRSLRDLSARAGSPSTGGRRSHSASWASSKAETITCVTARRVTSLTLCPHLEVAFNPSNDVLGGLSTYRRK